MTDEAGGLISSLIQSEKATLERELVTAGDSDRARLLADISSLDRLKARIESGLRLEDAAAAFDRIYSDWRAVHFEFRDPSRDESNEASEDRFERLLAAEEAFCAAETPTKQQLRHKFHYLEYSISQGNDCDVENAVASIKEDLQRWGFDLPELDDLEAGRETEDA